MEPRLAEAKISDTMEVILRSFRLATLNAKRLFQSIIGYAKRRKNDENCGCEREHTEKWDGGKTKTGEITQPKYYPMRDELQSPGSATARHVIEKANENDEHLISKVEKSSEGVTWIRYRHKHSSMSSWRLA